MRQPSALLSCAFLLVAVLAICAQAQTYQVIHNFTGATDGSHPQAGVTIDHSGSLYATTTAGGYEGGNCASSGCGAVVKLIQNASGWTVVPLYAFQGGAGGFLPDAPVMTGPGGALFGTTSAGGVDNNGYGYGTVFSLSPPAHACQSISCPWTETVLYQFAGLSSGWQPSLGNLTFDPEGNIWGTTMDGGSNGCYGGFGCGVVFKLTPTQQGWTETVVYSFTGGGDGAYPVSGVVFDHAGNIYGTTTGGGTGNCNSYVGGCGVIFKLSPSENGWAESALYQFSGGADGGVPVGGLTFSASGALYGTTELGGTGNGTVFELAPVGIEWTLNTIYTFPGPGIAGPTANLVLDAAGNIYGTTLNGPPNYPPCAGSVFELSLSAGVWQYQLLYCFSGGMDGGSPYSPVTLGANHTLYGTTYSGGAYGDGVVWELSQ